MATRGMFFGEQKSVFFILIYVVALISFCRSLRIKYIVERELELGNGWKMIF